ncbi:hypothetical protein HID58_074078 [Brassica napus]|uniref:F-box domain-containing protein n=2 Tax=Brassica TaxID=3705 RepID=A0ABQ7YIP5_BRANA|nr:hypothetical protein HID58_074078 [Brassica napus]VDD35158.1 unnamed protein product [Brassica oleracea]
MFILSCKINNSVSVEAKKKNICDIFTSELLQEILSRLSLKSNIQASAVCKTWCEAAVSVRKLQRRPWLFHQLRGLENGNYILLDPTRSQAYKFSFPVLDIYYLILGMVSLTLGYCLAFSAAPTSSSCLVISCNYTSIPSYIMINTWRPGETAWTTHRFKNQLPGGGLNNCVVSNGMFYCLSTCGYLGVFDPPRATCNILPVRPCLAFPQVDITRRMLMTEHEGDIFVMFTSRDKNPSVFKLNLKRMAWEKKSELGGLTVFASQLSSLTRASFSVKERNRLYPSRNENISSCPPSSNYFSNRIAWVFPPHDNVSL